MIRSFDFPLELKKSQETLLDSIFEEGRVFHNYCLRDRIELSQLGIEFLVPNAEAQEKLVSKYRKDKNNPILLRIYSQIFQVIAASVDQSWEDCKTNGKGKAPRYKEKGRFNTITFKQAGKGFGVKIVGNHSTEYENDDFVPGIKLLQVSKLGNLKFKQDKKMPGKLKTISITREKDGKYAVVFMREVPEEKLPVVCDSVGIDAGIDYYIVLSDGTYVENPRFLQTALKEIKKTQKLISEAPEGSKRRIQLERRLVKQHKKVQNRRKNFQHKLSRFIVNNYQNIAVEKLNINKMVAKKGKSKTRAFKINI